MELCVVSGKGGTGKTTLAVGLAVAVASAAPEAAEPVELVDCDVEAPNAHLYFGLGEIAEDPVAVPVPVWNRERCSGCGACTRACRFGAVGLFGSHLEVFAEHCHACGACLRSCPEGALTEACRPIGLVRSARTSGIDLRWGVLNLGEPRGTPIIQALRGRDSRRRDRVLDGPPGSSCSLVAAAKGADLALVVTELTPFGLHDLELAWRVLTLLEVPSAVVVNRAHGSMAALRSFCRSRGLPIALEIPLDKALAEAGARGVPLPVAEPFYGPVLRKLWVSCREWTSARRAA
ncbi:MAG: 4Fe-4S binding protein [Deltaproteobacteria bacterium]|nr:4Fe-4S binding protein [Deltaproteobacteria bacterium]